MRNLCIMRHVDYFMPNIFGHTIMNATYWLTPEGWEPPYKKTVTLAEPTHNLGYYDDDTWHHEDWKSLSTNSPSIENESQTTQDEKLTFVVNTENVKRIIKDWEKEEIAKLHEFLKDSIITNKPITFHFWLERSDKTFNETVSPESLPILREYLIEEIIRLTELEELEEIEYAMNIVDKVRRSIWRFFHSWN